MQRTRRGGVAVAYGGMVIDISKWRQQLLQRPPVATTPDRNPGEDSLVYFDLQHHWQEVRQLFERTDVRFAAAQGMRGRRACPPCSEYSSRSAGITTSEYSECWPIHNTDGCDGRVFPLFLSHHGRDVGWGGGSYKAELAFSWMPDEETKNGRRTRKTTPACYTQGMDGTCTCPSRSILRRFSHRPVRYLSYSECAG